MRTTTAPSAFRITAILACSLVLGSSLGCHRDPNKVKQKYLESGMRYANEGKLKEASIQFANAIRIDRNFGDAHFELAKVLLKEGSIMPAYAELLRAVDLQPNNVDARIQLGNLLLAGKQPDKAQEQANAVLALKPNNPDAYALLAGVAAAKGDRATAITQIEHAISLDPNRSAFHTSLGLLQSADSATSNQGEDQLRKAVSLDKKNVTAAIVLAALLQKKGDLTGAQQQLLDAKTAAPDNVMVRAALADIYFRQNNTAQGEQTLHQATEELNDSDAGAELLANYYIGSNQVARGESDYAALVSKYPKSIPLKLAYARLLILNHNVSKARDIAADLAKADSTRPEVAVLNGMLMLNDGKTNDAFNVLQKAAKANPDSFAVQLWYGRAAQAKGDLSTAQQSFRQATRINPKNLEAQEALANIAVMNNDFSTLSDVAKAAIAANPGASAPHVWQGIADANQKLNDKAESDFNQALKLNPRDAQALFQLGRLRLTENKTPEGKTLLEQALAINPNDSRALQLVVAAMSVEKQAPKAIIARVQDQIAKAPQNAQMYDLLAGLQLQTGDTAGGLASSEKALQLNPSDSAATMFYSRAQIAMGQAPKALEKWRQWTKDHPRDASGFTVLGSLQDAQGDRDGAIASYKAALAIQPDQAVANNNLANLMVETGQNLDVALTLAQAARRALPDSPDTADTLAWIYYQKGNYESARGLLEDAAKTAPQNAAIHYHLGMTYAKLARTADAATELKKAASLAPNTQTAKDAQTALKSLS
ncbi:tetratricopeptide repeat protein [Edaphobacter sp.]|uniref:tetratricopeptide repeat protein n=1 Tax=Edaphobacter sp. TaxID=1934404 RepID=UPI002DBA3AAF|nr:tetratricopeptide repeat protein [Edaphobacter sp.]HEU5339639.1 tetratricopeptide repeat protein [Edaphobacter sp.]